MTVEEIVDHLDLIKEHARNGDFECAHSEEKHLYQCFVEDMAKYPNMYQDRAKLILTSQKIKFTRVFA